MPTQPNSILVVKLGGQALQHHTALQQLRDAWSNRPEGTAWVLVHGGGPQIDLAMESAGITITKRDGVRVTSPVAAAIVQATLDDIGSKLCATLQDTGVSSTHLPSTSRVLAATPKEGFGNRTGTAMGILNGPALDAEILTVITPVGWDAQGPLNVNADEGAAAIATALGATRLVLATDVQGFLDAKGALVPRMDLPSVRQAIVDGTAKGGMIPKLEHAVFALSQGVGAVEIGHLGNLLAGGPGTRMVSA